MVPLFGLAPMRGVGGHSWYKSPDHSDHSTQLHFCSGSAEAMNAESVERCWGKLGASWAALLLLYQEVSGCRSTCLDLKIRHKSMVSVTLTPSGWQRVAARIVNGNYWLALLFNRLFRTQGTHVDVVYICEMSSMPSLLVCVSVAAVVVAVLTTVPRH